MKFVKHAFLAFAFGILLSGAAAAEDSIDETEKEEGPIGDNLIDGPVTDRVGNYVVLNCYHKKSKKHQGAYNIHIAKDGTISMLGTTYSSEGEARSAANKMCNENGGYLGN